MAGSDESFFNSVEGWHASGFDYFDSTLIEAYWRFKPLSTLLFASIISAAGVFGLRMVYKLERLLLLMWSNLLLREVELPRDTPETLSDDALAFAGLFE